MLRKMWNIFGMYFAIWSHTAKLNSDCKQIIFCPIFFIQFIITNKYISNING